MKMGTIASLWRYEAMRGSFTLRALAHRSRRDRCALLTISVRRRKIRHMDVTIHIPDDLAARLGTAGDLPRRVLEALAVEEIPVGTSHAAGVAPVAWIGDTSSAGRIPQGSRGLHRVYGRRPESR
jgi:hypothetical protein